MTIEITKADVLTAGGQRAIYQHPHDASKLIKVLHPDVVVKGRSRFASLTETWFPGLRNRAISKEYQEYLRIMLANPEPDFAPPFSHFYGFVTTNLGLGCLTEKICAADGGLGSTLRDLNKISALTQTHIDLLNKTISRIFQLNIRASDLNAGNLVFGHRDAGGTLAPLDCIVVDGLGDVHAIPVRSMARWSNKIALQRSFARLARKNAPLVWDNDQCKISIDP